jgi:hypothetical protein
MSKATLTNISMQGLSALSSTHGARNVFTYFITNNKNKSLIQHPGLRFKSGGWQEDNKKWSLLWTIEGNKTPRSICCICWFVNIILFVKYCLS